MYREMGAYASSFEETVQSTAAQLAATPGNIVYGWELREQIGLEREAWDREDVSDILASNYMTMGNTEGDRRYLRLTPEA